jgi:hypothetical protein
MKRKVYYLTLLVVVLFLFGLFITNESSSKAVGKGDVYAVVASEEAPKAEEAGEEKAEEAEAAGEEKAEEAEAGEAKEAE